VSFVEIAQKTTKLFIQKLNLHPIVAMTAVGYSHPIAVSKKYINCEFG